MATTFGCDPVVARQLAGELGQIRADLTTLGAIFNAYDGTLGSGRVETTLDDFVSESSDVREKLDHLLERAGGMLTSLADGVRDVDLALADAFSTDSEQ